MVTYHFVCESCEVQGDVVQSIKDSLPEQCPECGATEPHWHQVYSGENFCFVRQEPTTVGQQAELNAKRVGREQMQIMGEQSQIANRKAKFSGKIPSGGRKLTDTTKAARPWWRPNADKPLNVSKLKDPTKFILEGKTN